MRLVRKNTPKYKGLLSVVITEQIADGFTATKGHGDLRADR